MQDKSSQWGLVWPLLSACCLLKDWSRQSLKATMEVPTPKGVKEAHEFIKLCCNI